MNSSVICPGDPRFIRMRKVLTNSMDSEVLTWADGTPVGFRVSAPIPNAELAQIVFEKISSDLAQPGRSPAPVQSNDGEDALYP